MADGDKIRVIIVDDIAETRDNLEKLLYFEKDIQVVGKAATGREAIAQAKQHNPDIILMDINMPDMDGITATEQIIATVPAAQVIMMSVQGESDYLRRAMMAGAREFLTKPISGDELVNSIRHVYKLALQQRPRIISGGPGSQPLEDTGKKGQVIAVFSPKGGVGVTALASNLAVAMKLLPGNKRVALVDGNLIFGDVGVVLDTRSNKTISDLISRVNDLDHELLNDVLATHNSQVKVLLPPSNPQDGELVTADHLRSIISSLRREFDLVVVDTQSSLQDTAMTVLDEADRIVLVMTLEMTSIKNVKQFLELAELLEYSADKLLLVLNKADSKLGLRVEQIEANLKHKVSAQIGNAPNEMTIAINRGVPLVLDRSLQTAKDILSLANMLMSSDAKVAAATKAAPEVAANKSEPGATTPAPAQRGLFSRIMSKR